MSDNWKVITVLVGVKTLVEATMLSKFVVN